MDSITIDANGFKKFVLENSPGLKEIDAFCVLLSHAMDIEPIELADELAGSLNQSIYCPDTALCEKYGFLTDDDLNGDVESAIENAGALKSQFNAVKEAWFNWGTESPQNGFYDGELMFGSQSELTNIAKQHR
ncbi:hypothetical protein [Salinivibrio costicola]|uniref:hypothetical protein n=1 Tax=Salinivibrio costicola TaxID=51367 RepID=UPI00046E7130|nr:hypothetical protein [Salinivibrio costicola]